MRVERVGVLGCGLMGSGISEVVARAGYEVRVVELNKTALEAGSARLVRSLERAGRAGKDQRAGAGSQLGQNLVSYRLGAAVRAGSHHRGSRREAGCQERALWRTRCALSGSNDPGVEYVVPLDHRHGCRGRSHRTDRVIGLHFLNPVPVMNLVEIVHTIATSESTLECVTAFARSLGKETVTVRDSSGFVVNRLLMPFMLNAIQLVETGVASIEELDKSMVLGYGHLMGPLTLCDFVGNDIVHRIAEIMYSEYRSDGYAPPPLLKRLVTMGRFGLKSGAGFYDYSGKDPVAISL